MLIVLRLLQGLGAGAEQAGASVLMTEYAPRDRRGFFAAIPFMGIQLGTVAASLIYFVLLLQIQDVAQTWLWRVPFLLSVVLIAVAIWIRLRLKESPEFTKLEARHQVDDRPLTHLLENSKRTVLLGRGLRMAENGGSSLYQALAVSYIVGVVGLKGEIGALSLVFAPLVGALVVPLAGMLSDRYGRVIVYRAFAIFQLLIAFPVWWVLSGGNVAASLIVMSIALGVGVWGMFGAQGALRPSCSVHAIDTSVWPWRGKYRPLLPVVWLHLLVQRSLLGRPAVMVAPRRPRSCRGFRWQRICRY
jgi:MHS family metabolite:H+ symporter-like MFS transporter